MNEPPGESDPAQRTWETFLPWAKRCLIWGLILGILYILGDFFGIIFLTFIFSYISVTVVNRLTEKFGRRKLMTVLVFLVYLGILVVVGLRIVPVVYQEARDMADRFPDMEESGEEVLSGGSTPVDLPLVDRFLKQLLGEQRFDQWVQSDWYVYMYRRITTFLSDKVPNLIEYAGSLFRGIFTMTFHFVLALLFSFLIVLDQDRFADKLSSLRNSRLSHIYVEVEPGIRSFFGVLGRAFEAQALIALVNTVLTMIGIIFMQLPNAALLAAIVFFCSFIPVFGVIISTLPIALLALKTGGPILMFFAIGWVLLVHAIETYILNPQIYGVHMELHPLMVLIVLLVGEHFFGIWGLILGVPVFRYVWNQLILGQEPKFKI